MLRGRADIENVAHAAARSPRLLAQLDHHFARDQPQRNRHRRRQASRRPDADRLPQATRDRGEQTVQRGHSKDRVGDRQQRAQD